MSLETESPPPQNQAEAGSSSRRSNSRRKSHERHADLKVLSTLLEKEVRYIPATFDYFQRVQDDVTPEMRCIVSEWMLDICLVNECESGVFCMAMNYFDRFLGVCRIKRNQLQLLGAVCLLVSWKVRQNSPLAAQTLVTCSDHNISQDDIVDWEVLLLHKLDWDMAPIIPLDFLQVLIDSLSGLDIRWRDGSLKEHAEKVLVIAAKDFRFAFLPASLIACVALLHSFKANLLHLDESVEFLAETLAKLVETESGLILDRLTDVNDLVKLSKPQGGELKTPRKAEADAGGDFETPTKVLEASFECTK